RELQLASPAHERREPLTEPQPRRLEAYELVNPSGRSIASGPGREDKASFEERAQRLAHENGPLLGARHECVQSLPCLASRRMVDSRRTAYPSDQDLTNVETNADSEGLRRAATGALRHPLHGESRVRRPACGLLSWLQPEHSHECCWAHLLDLAAEALDLVNESLQRGAQGGDTHPRRRRDEIGAEQGDVPALPPQGRPGHGRGLRDRAHYLGRRWGFARARQPL